MAKTMIPQNTDAAGIKPRFIPDAELLPRDDSGGPDWQPYTQQFGDGGYVQGQKPHLTWDDNGKEDEMDGDEISQEGREREFKAQTKGYKRAERADMPARSKKEAKE